jgi:hypothetical protein
MLRVSLALLVATWVLALVRLALAARAGETPVEIQLVSARDAA